ncbi:lantibiotic dehydratase [Lactonifactor longoviformis]|uniref:lantibiotic dehydratase n=1 Tax=Lactonifactor longoviformis TaxID=341220 RepID=UPI0036F2D8C8
MEYIIGNNFLLRAPLQGFNQFSKIEMLGDSTNSILSLVKEDPIFCEALAIANLELWMKIKKRKLNTTQREAIIKYYIRYLSRPTPYGMFAGVRCGNFGEMTSCETGSEEDTDKYCCVDMAWFYGVIQTLEKDIDVVYNTKVKFNSECFIQGDRIVNPYNHNYGQLERKEEYYKNSKIRFTRQVKFIKDNTSDWIPFQKLFETFADYNLKVPKDKLESFLLSLIENGFLITDIRGGLSERDPLQNLLDQMKDYRLNIQNCKYYEKLLKVNELRLAYSCKPYGKGIDLYQNLCEKMEEIHKTSNYINVICQHSIKKISLNQNIKKELERFANFLTAVSSPDNEPAYLTSYKERFLDKYGANIEVPLLELFNPVAGLGNPYEIPMLKTGNEYKGSKKRELIEKYFKDKILFCIKNQIRECVIDDEDIKNLNQIQMSHKGSKISYASSFELNVAILAEKTEQIDKNNYKIILGHCIGANRIGMLTNRFYNALSAAYKEEIAAFYKREIDNAKYLYAESIHLPREGRVNNVSGGKKNYKYQLNYNLAPENYQTELSMQDLVIGINAEHDRFYIKSKAYNKIIAVVSDSMITRLDDDCYIRFLREVTYAYHIEPLENIYYLQANESRYIPQIRYGNVIIQRECWKLYREDMRTIENYRDFTIMFSSFMHRWGLPRWIYVGIDDKYLILDLFHDTGMQCLYSEIKKSLRSANWVILESAEREADSNTWLTDTSQKIFFSEITVECIKQNMMSAENTIEGFNGAINLPDKNKILYPGQEGWYYFKIYLEESQCNDFLRTRLSAFAEYLLENQIIEKFFFIRYSDPDFHIRFRIQVSKQFDIIHIFNQWFDRDCMKGFSIYYTIDIYERESERYGGSALINEAEDYFYQDSLLVLNILQSEDESIEISLEYIAVSAIFNIAKHIIKNMESAELYLNNLTNPELFRNEFQKNRAEYMGILENKERLPLLLRQSMRKVEESLDNYFIRMNQISESNHLTNYSGDIFLSLCHMFCNRLCGDRNWETRVFSIARHTLHAWNEKQKYYVSAGKIE